MKFLLNKILFVLVAISVLLFAFSNMDMIKLQLWPLVGSLYAPLFLVVLIVFVGAFFLGVLYSRVTQK